MTTTLKAGARPPAFCLPATCGTLSLAEFAGRKLVLFFFPKASTEGCTREARDFSRLAPAFAAAGTAVIGVSADPLRRLETFQRKQELTVPLASDVSTEMLSAYGLWIEKTMYGRRFMGIPRTTLLIGADGRIARIWSSVKVDGHAEEVLVAAQAL